MTRRVVSVCPLHSNAGGDERRGIRTFNGYGMSLWFVDALVVGAYDVKFSGQRSVVSAGWR